MRKVRNTGILLIIVLFSVFESRGAISPTDSCADVFGNEIYKHLEVLIEESDSSFKINRFVYIVGVDSTGYINGLSRLVIYEPIKFEIEEDEREFIYNRIEGKVKLCFDHQELKRRNAKGIFKEVKIPD